MPALIPQPNGRGALRAGGTPGHKGGPGVPSKVVRMVWREALHRRLDIAEAIADYEERPEPRLRALDLMARIAGLARDADPVEREHEAPRVVFYVPANGRDVQRLVVSGIPRIELMERQE
ncbi:MAG: hypothetical protein UY40_C0013G0011 [candidate division CPR1 bacterium GW2011_GWC1_49_13]|uniref:Uncharacterized protein n=1 Tax=candidate division CPR1 bacterium GW2011_GWC1_49_13 TaxID=1618342 RepID=A0A0G1VGG9_9BACT|nr:MAG: hypothetical protein UY40_C0013G0011 [candidate division CPR1 bacterium GW2011_GWC1_49_13]